MDGIAPTFISGDSAMQPVADTSDVHYATSARRSGERNQGKLSESMVARPDTGPVHLVTGRAVLLTFYDFPAAHFQHIHTSNPIEPTLATIRLRTAKPRNCVSAKSGLALVYKLAISAEKHWRRLRGFKHLADLVTGIKFIDGIDEREISRKDA